jgi:hypothetical protein
MSTVYQSAENVKQYAEIKAQKEKRIENMQRMKMSNKYDSMPKIKAQES